jgi:hypothetical protein
MTWTPDGWCRQCVESEGRKASLAPGRRCLNRDDKWVLNIRYSPRIIEREVDDVEIIWSQRRCATLEEAKRQAEIILEAEWQISGKSTN